MAFRNRARVRRILAALGLSPAPTKLYDLAHRLGDEDTPAPAPAPVEGPAATSSSAWATQSATRGRPSGSGLDRYRSEPGVDFAPDFTLTAEVAQRFNAYATAAYPYEIGGMLRVVEQEDGSWLATDLRVFRQKVSPATFELDGTSVAEFNMSLFRDGKKDELPEWRALIHSHPSMTPFMSGPDRENIERLAGAKFAFSVICSAHPNPRDNYYAVHYCQGTPLPLVVHDLPVRGENLSGLSLLDDDTLRGIEADVDELCEDRFRGSRTIGSGDLVAVRDRQPDTKPPAGPLDFSRAFDRVGASVSYGSSASASAEPDEFDPVLDGFVHNGEVFCGELSDEEYELADAAIAWALTEDIADEDDLQSIREHCDGEKVMTDPRLIRAFYDTLAEAHDRAEDAFADKSISPDDAAEVIADIRDALDAALSAHPSA